MYIKIKHIKQFVLISVCIFFAGFNYLTYVNADNSSEESTYVCDKSADSDCDGLTNAEEKLYGTDPEKADTDGDSYSDGVEIKSGYDPLKPAPGDRIETTSNLSENKALKASEESTTSTYSRNLSAYIESKRGQSVSVDDVKNFANEQLSKNMGESITLETLPEIDKSQIKILEQDYANLSDEKRKEKEAEDSQKYMTEIAYLLVSNAPTTLSTKEDFVKLKEDFFSHLANISDLKKDDLEYFSEFGDSLELFLNQAAIIEVPEKMVDLHIKFLRIAKGILTLRDSSLDPNDSIDRVIIIKKVSSYTQLASDFFKNDLTNYLNSLK